ncbi:hypothetical protein K505DRAFT_413127 [Melanomma pulvis-pyrius CBS 109.77]|uniref:Uncharacterized protein n=1 Tax=Melanomma pulvis-pyrius CBS 109.77 TaxID=1314802 RepID=A0A6A6XWT0_9PLEO|nr:hypothetical protein K505DRAFT_413127 [Melanomma pulvis-pyrius CBS 109.77]
MPAQKLPRWPSAPYPIINGTNPTTTTEPAKVGAPQAAEATPTFIPTPVYQTVQVVPADKIVDTTTTSYAEITQYPGAQATILQGYCSEPAYTILDGSETALWVPVIGCMSSKSECCATTTTSGSGAASTGGTENINPKDDSAGKGVQFPISFMPAQGTLTGCPQDYHTVGSTACCPSSYWLWSTQIGGQVPCYSSLGAKMIPPPIPDTLVHRITGTESHSTSVSSTSESQKPTLAIVNIAYAMQYHVVPLPKRELDKKVKIGLGVGVGVAAILVGLLIAFLARKFLVHRRVRTKVQDSNEPLRLGAGEGMSHVVTHDGAPNSKTFGGAEYVGVSTTRVGH